MLSLFWKNRPIRVDILTASTVLLFVTVGLIVSYTFFATKDSVLQMSGKLMNRVQENVVKETTGYFQPPLTVVRMTSKLFASASGFKLPLNPPLERYCLEIVRNLPQVWAVNLADANGNFMMVKKTAGGQMEVKYINRSQAAPTVQWKLIDKNGVSSLSPQSRKVKYDPRPRPWYQGALKKKGVFFSDVYTLFTDRMPAITVSAPVKNSVGKLLGVVGVDIRLDTISHFLGRLKVGQTGMAFIINARSQVVAYPEASRLVVSDASGTHLVKMADLGVGLVERFARAFAKGSDGKRLFSYQDRNYIGTLNSFPSDFQKGWKIAIMVPEDDFIGGIKETNLHSLAFSAGLLLLSIWAAVLISNSITRPIRGLIGETIRIKDFQLDGEVEVASSIREIKLMQEAFKNMKASLRSFTKFAPDQVVRQVLAQGEEAVLAGEKRSVTVLFSDLRGFTGFAESHGPEEVVATLNTHFDVMVRLISEHGGFVCDFLGDSVFAVFGAPEPDEDHAAHAVACAVRMQLALTKMNQEATEGQPELEMGIGVNSGDCVVGNMGSQLRIKYGVVGSAVNLGSRIESFSVGGQVLISDDTKALLAGGYQTQGPYQVSGKGIPRPINLWEVRGEKGRPQLTLPPTVPDLTGLDQPAAVSFQFLSGKMVEEEVHQADLLKVSKAGALIQTQAPLSIFAPLLMQLPSPGGGQLAMDARVVHLSPEKAQATVRFSGVRYEDAAWLIQTGLEKTTDIT